MNLWSRIKHRLGFHDSRILIKQMVSGGGKCFGRMCPSCGDVVWIEYPRNDVREAVMDRKAVWVKEQD